MTDVNTPLIKAYFDALTGNITMPVTGDPVDVWEGEEPDNPQARGYIVISDVIGSDNSAKTCAYTNTSIQIGIYTWELQSNTAKTANDLARQIFALVNPTPVSTLLAPGIQIVTTKLTTDRTDRVGKLAGRKYINRFLIFSHYIYIQN